MNTSLDPAPSGNGSPHSDAPDQARWVGVAIGLGVVLFIGGMLAISALWGGGRDAFVAWFGSPAPTITPAPVATPSPSQTPTSQGLITGVLSSPAGVVPVQTVCAELVNNTNVSACVDHEAGQPAEYKLSVPAGKYYVFARLKDETAGVPISYRAYYTRYITCGGGPDCSEGLHSQYVPVVVAAGATAQDVNPTDWNKGASN